MSVNSIPTAIHMAHNTAIVGSPRTMIAHSTSSRRSFGVAQQRVTPLLGVTQQQR
jgi:hypothetical protein